MNYTEYTNAKPLCNRCNVTRLSWHEVNDSKNMALYCEVCRLKLAASLRKSTKRVFKSDEIPHLFVHQIQESAWTSTKNLSFNGPNYKSYTTIIASRVVNRKGELAFLIDEYRHSMTTGRQIDDLLRAIPQGTKIMRVYRSDVDNGREYVNANDPTDPNRYEFRDKKNGRTPDHSANLEHWREQVANKLKEAAKSREPKKSRLMGEAASVVDKMCDYASFFAIPVKVAKYPKLPGSIAELATMQAANIKRDALAAKKLEEKRRIQYAEQIKEATESIKLWEAGDNAYRNRSYAHLIPTSLRIVGSEIETSQGANFPIEHAKRGLALVESVIASGKAWKKNGHTCHLGHYQIDSIDVDGTVHAGCHVVPYASILRIRESILSFIANTNETTNVA